MTEAFLHYIWQHQMIAEGLTTTDGRPVVVLKAGLLNRDAGPDFFSARVMLDGVEWVGNVEVHIKSSDWHAHHHSDDKAYNNVILHVVYEHDREIALENGRSPATIELRRWMNPALVRCYDRLMAPAEGLGIPCAQHIGAVPQVVVSSFMERLAAERLEQKSDTVRRLLDESRGGWEQTCYWMIARYFGGRVNALPFELLAKATDQRLLARWRDDAQRVEALLMGQAGLLEGYFEDEYPRLLQADYEAIRAGAELRPIDGYLWKFSKMRPSSFPTVRISQFAKLICCSKNLFAHLLDTTDANELTELFMTSTSPYWFDHYRFDRVAAKAKEKRIGRMQAQMLVINAWAPLLFVYGRVHGIERYEEQAIGLLEQMEAEDNAVVRRWNSAGIVAANAADSQALLQLEQAYCEGRRCLECKIGYSVLKHEKES